MPQTEVRNPEVAGGEKDVQQQANELETAAGPAKEQQEQEFADLTPNSPPEGVELVDPRMEPDPVPSYGGEDQEFLFGMTDRPGEPVSTGATSGRPQPPKNVYRYLSILAKAAEDPDAPEELHAFIRILQETLSAAD